MNFLRAVGRSLRWVLWVLFVIVGSRLVLLAIGAVFFIAAAQPDGGPDGLFVPFIMAAVVNLFLHRWAKGVKPEPQAPRLSRRKAKRVPLALASTVARTVDAPNEATVIGRLDPAFRRLLDPPPAPQPAPAAAAPVQHSAPPAPVHAPAAAPVPASAPQFPDLAGEPVKPASGLVPGPQSP